MFPTILEFGPFHIRSYGLLLAVSFVIGITFSARRAARDGLDPERVVGLTWLIILLGVFGARALYVIQHPGDFSGVLEALRVWRGGLTLYGGLILGVVGSLLYLRRRVERPWGYADAMAPFISLGEGITRIGCFLNGCCFGRSCALPWSVQFPSDGFATQVLGPDHHIHPTQLYQSALGFAAFLFLSWKWRRRAFEGQVFWLFVIFHAASRFLVDFTRYYEQDQLASLDGVALSDSQLLSLVLVVAGLLGFSILRRRAAAGSA